MIEITEPQTSTSAVDYVRELVALLARYHRAHGLSASKAYQLALREFAVEYPDEIQVLEQENAQTHATSVSASSSDSI